MKLSRVRPVQPGLHSIDTLTRLGNTHFGRLYKKRFKQYAVFRQLTAWVWRRGYPLYVKWISSIRRKPQPLICLSDFIRMYGIPSHQLAESAIIETPPPTVFPECDQGYLTSPHDRYRFPEIYVAILNNAITSGGTNFVLVDGKVICHEQYDFSRDFTPEEQHGRALINPKLKHIRLLLNDEAPETIPVAATFVDGCAANYAHWITEVLPKLAMFCTEPQFSEIPIVVNDGLHKNIMESIFLVAGSKREIITLPIGRALVVEKLYLTSAVGYVPFDRRTPKLTGHSHGKFSPAAFELLRNNIDKLDFLKEKSRGQDWPEKIFIRRNAGARIITNAAEIEKLVIKHGYSIIEPEKLTFLQQTRLFSHAKEVVGPSGAAFANIVFSPKDAKILILTGKFPNTSYWYWQNIACASGKKIEYILGDIESRYSKQIHSDFSINPKHLLTAITMHSTA